MTIMETFGFIYVVLAVLLFTAALIFFASEGFKQWRADAQAGREFRAEDQHIRQIIRSQVDGK